MADSFESYRAGLESPCEHLFDADAAKSDTVDLTNATRALYVEVAGDVKLDTVGGDTVTMNLTAGWHPIRATRIYSTGTAATGIFGAY